MAPATKADQFSTEEMFGALITIEVGDPSTRDDCEGSGNSTYHTFSLHKGVLSFYSGYLAAALNNSRFAEAQSGIVTLPSEDQLIFQIFAHWLYTRRFYDSSLAPKALMQYISLAQLWVFGDAHDIPILQNDAIHVFMRRLGLKHKPLDEKTVRFVWENTVGRSKLRMVVENYIRYIVAIQAPLPYGEGQPDLTEVEDVLSLLRASCP